MSCAYPSHSEIEGELLDILDHFRCVLSVFQIVGLWCCQFTWVREFQSNRITTALRSNQRYRTGAYNQQNHHEHYFYRDQYLGTLHGIPKTVPTFIVPWSWILFVCRYFWAYASMLQHPTAKKEDTGQTCEGSIECESGSGEWYTVLVTLNKLKAIY